jgi:hypothetical protein
MAMTTVLLGGRSCDHTVHPWYETRQPHRGHHMSTNITWYEHQTRRRPAGGALAPRARRKATRGCQNLERGGTSPASSLTLERNGGSFESGWCGCLMGRGGRWAATGCGFSPCSMFPLMLFFVLRERFFVSKIILTPMMEFFCPTNFKKRNSVLLLVFK